MGKTGRRPQRVFFTADNHFGHAGIIDMACRPFRDVDEMDRSMIECWNAVVQPGDVVWHAGDFAHRCEPGRLQEIFKALHGTKNLVIGNHDKAATTRLGWAEMTPFKQLVVDGIQVNLMHYGMRVWPGMHKGSLMLFGHSHSRLPGSRQTLDVGVDAVGFAPIDLADIQARMTELPRVSYAHGHPIDDYDDELAEGVEP